MTVFGHREAVGVGSRTCSGFLLHSAGNSLALIVDLFRVSRESEETAERDAGGFLATLEKKETGRLGEKKHASAEDGAPCELNTDRSPPRRV
jgi:hypothetical protein